MVNCFNLKCISFNNDGNFDSSQGWLHSQLLNLSKARVSKKNETEINYLICIYGLIGPTYNGNLLKTLAKQQ